MVTIKHKFIQYLKQNNIYEYFMLNMTKNKHITKFAYNNINPLIYFSNNEMLWKHALKWNNILSNRKRKLFIQFLNDNKIKERFEKNLKQKHNITLETYINNHMWAFIPQAFKWEMTPEGEQFWQEMANKELNFLQQHCKPTSTW